MDVEDNYFEFRVKRETDFFEIEVLHTVCGEVLEYSKYNSGRGEDYTTYAAVKRAIESHECPEDRNKEPQGAESFMHTKPEIFKPGETFTASHRIVIKDDSLW